MAILAFQKPDKVLMLEADSTREIRNSVRLNLFSITVGNALPYSSFFVGRLCN